MEHGRAACRLPGPQGRHARVGAPPGAERRQRASGRDDRPLVSASCESTASRVAPPPAMRRSTSFPSRLSEDPRLAQRRWLSASVEEVETLADLVIPDQETLVGQRTQRVLLGPAGRPRSRPGSPEQLLPALSPDLTTRSPTKASRIRRHAASTDAVRSPMSAPTARRLDGSTAAAPAPTEHATVTVVRLTSGVLLGCCIRWPAHRTFPLISSIEEGGVLHQVSSARSVVDAWSRADRQ